MADPKHTHSLNTLISLRIKFYFCSLLTTMLCKQTIFLWVGWRCYPPTLLSSLSLSFRKEEKDESIFSSTNFSHRNRFEQIYSFFISLSLSLPPLHSVCIMNSEWRLTRVITSTYLIRKWYFFGSIIAAQYIVIISTNYVFTIARIARLPILMSMEAQISVHNLYVNNLVSMVMRL